MKRRYLIAGLTLGTLAGALLIWWLREPALPPPPDFRNAPSDAFALGVQGHTNDARGNKLVICFFANPKEYGIWLTPVGIERRNAETGEWKRLPFPKARRWKVSPGHTENFHFKPPDGDSPWRVVFERSRVMTLTERLEQAIQTVLQGTKTAVPGRVAANQKFETRTPDLLGVDFAPAYSLEPLPSRSSGSKAE
jgi:hypothetical protein